MFLCLHAPQPKESSPSQPTRSINQPGDTLLGSLPTKAFRYLSSFFLLFHLRPQTGCSAFYLALLDTMPRYHPATLVWGANDAPLTDRWCGTCFPSIVRKIQHAAHVRHVYLSVIVDGNPAEEDWHECSVGLNPLFKCDNCRSNNVRCCFKVRNPLPNEPMLRADGY